MIKKDFDPLRPRGYCFRIPIDVLFPHLECYLWRDAIDFCCYNNLCLGAICFQPTLCFYCKLVTFFWRVLFLKQGLAVSYLAASMTHLAL